MVEAPQENIVLDNVESVLVEESDGNAIYFIRRRIVPVNNPRSSKRGLTPVEFFVDEQGFRWVKFWPKNGPAKGKQMSIPIERLIGVIHK
jgi:hypothetical protein